MPRYKLTLEYDGTGLVGWQRQESGLSVQAVIEEAVRKFCGEPRELVCAGRTDAGVHALGQVAHLDLPKDYDAFRVQQGINFHLLPELRVVVVDAERVADDFHARFSAVKRAYLYRIVNRRTRLAVERDRAWQIIEPLDAEAMHEAAQLLLGHHDFTSFRDSRCQAKSPMKTLDRLDVIALSSPSPQPSPQRGEGVTTPATTCETISERTLSPLGRGQCEGEAWHVEIPAQEIRIVAEARSFLHHQVRNMVGSLRLVGSGKWSPGDIKKALLARDRTQGGETAPPQGLYLTGVGY